MNKPTFISLYERGTYNQMCDVIMNHDKLTISDDEKEILPTTSL